MSGKSDVTEETNIFTCGCDTIIASQNTKNVGVCVTERDRDR